jgi:hypothetical protein
MQHHGLERRAGGVSACEQDQKDLGLDVVDFKWLASLVSGIDESRSLLA